MGKILKKNPIKIINWIYTMLVVMIGWVLFRSPNLYDALRYFKYLFVFRKPVDALDVISSFNMNVVIMALSGILLTGWLQRGLEKLMKNHNQSVVIRFLSIVFQALLLGLSICMLVNGSYNPSIYANF